MASDELTALRHYEIVRQRSLALAGPLSDEDCGAQSMPDASPVKWHLAHTTWFFETFILERFEPGFSPFHPAFRVLFNSYYNGIGARHPRAQRGLLTRPAMDQVRAYRANVDTRIARVLAALPGDDELASLLVLGLQHEQQHQELMLTDIKHLLAQNALYPAYQDAAPAPAGGAAPVAPLAWTRFPGGVVEIGYDGDGFCFDNELPRHRQFIEPFALASRLVTNGEYLQFVAAGGYRDPTLWLSEGWDNVCAQSLAHPLYWQSEGNGAAAGQWHEFTLQGLQRLDLSQPATNLSLFEADAYARFAGARLPTEAEWESAARAVESEACSAAAGPGAGLAEMFGHCWQWTSSSYAPYPGYATTPGALGEYNGKFMLNQYVLRGSSHATAPGHARASYRNFFPASARWQFAGIRLAQ
jgi:ergothioneine biosynthesis protein EgtB